jgi:plasmid maintenance system killer protein
MVFIRDIRIGVESIQYLKDRWLEKQYKKAKLFILAGNYKNVDLKLRLPKEKKVWYFRINKQYRAICKLEEGILYVLAIDNHQ